MIMDKDTRLTIGSKIRTKVEFAGVPEGTEGYVVGHDHSGYCIAWDLDNQTYPHQYSFKEVYEMPAGRIGSPLRDWFSSDELKYLEIVSLELEQP